MFTPGGVGGSARAVGQSIFEARQGSPGSGDYHGYPLTPEQAEDFQRRNAGF